MTIRSRPSRRRCPLRTSRGSKEPTRSRGHLQVDRAGLAVQLLGRGAVAGVAGAGPLVRLVSQMLGQLLGQSALEHRLGHLPQQPVLAEQLHTLLAGPRHQVLGQRGIDDLLLAFLGLTPGAPSHRQSVGRIVHRVSSPSRSHGPGSRSRTYTCELTRPLGPCTPAERFAVRTADTGPALDLTALAEGAPATTGSAAGSPATASSRCHGSSSTSASTTAANSSTSTSPTGCSRSGWATN